MKVFLDKKGVTSKMVFFSTKFIGTVKFSVVVIGFRAQI